MMLAALSAVSIAAALTFAGSAAATPLTWSVAVGVDAPHEISSLSCASTTLCVAVDRQFTDVVTTTKPTAGAAAWTVTPIGTDDAVGVSCALGASSTKLCVALDCLPQAWWSTNPTGGAGTWTKTALGEATCGFHTTTAISCATTAMCVGTDSIGDVIATGDATGAGTEWVFAKVDGSTGINAISCPSTSLCVGVDNAGNAVTSGSPLGGAGSWTVTKIDGTSPVLSVSCAVAPTTLCVAADNAGNVITTTNPTGGSWTPAHVDGAGSNSHGMSCPSSTLCVGVDNEGNALMSTNPTGGEAAWTKQKLGITVLTAVSCASESLCVAADWKGNIYDGTGGPIAPPSGNPEEKSKGKAGEPETSHVIAPEAQILSTEGQVTTLLSCPPIGGECGPLNIELSAQVKVEGKKIVGALAKAKKKKPTVKSVTVGKIAVSLAAGQHKKVTIPLNATGKSLLAKFKHLTTHMRFIAKGKVLGSRTVKLTKAGKHKPKKHR
jgi:hypothetical protein